MLGFYTGAVDRLTTHALQGGMMMFNLSGQVDNNNTTVCERTLAKGGYLVVEVNELGGMVFDAYLQADSEDDAEDRTQRLLGGVEITTMSVCEETD